MRCRKYATFILELSICITFVYPVDGDDSKRDFFLSEDKQFHEWRSLEDKHFAESGVCRNESRSHVEFCRSQESVVDLFDLKSRQCFCDDKCHVYGDCCINLASHAEFENIYDSPWKCRDVGEANNSKTPIYVFQKCPETWTDPYVQTMCEVEAAELNKNKMPFSYMQDIPVKSKTKGLFYRNVFCALCNSESELEQWDSFVYCSGNHLTKFGEISENKFDFSHSTYDTRTKKFQNVLVDGKRTNCRIVVRDFRLKTLIGKHKARLCKTVIHTCKDNTDGISLQKCRSYTSFVYEKNYPLTERKVYKNFHCALCNHASIEKLTCIDPYYPILFADPDYSAGATLTFLFDFNFEGNNNQVGVTSPCRIKEGYIWDNLLKKCTNFTCGSLFVRKGLNCVPRVGENITGGLNDSCYKRILSKNEFAFYRNRTVFLKQSNKLLTPDEYEINEKDGYEVISISVCMEEGSFLLSFSKYQYWLAEITLSLSIICLILHLLVYGTLKELRNCPGKVLMSLSVCTICGHIFLLIGKYAMFSYWMCYVCGVLTHFGYLSSFLWMNVMSYDIYRTFSITQTQSPNKKKRFLKYSLYAWTSAVLVTFLSVMLDKAMHEDNEFRPKYGNPICWFNRRKGLLIFFVLPVFILLIKNVIFFIFTAFRIRKISKETKMVKRFSDKIRYMLYIKLTVVFGLTWLLGVLAGVLKVSFLWYPFIILNGLQGVFIFAAFTLKRNILKKLLIKFKINSDSYKMGKQSAVKRAIYSSLSNLSSLQPTLSTQLPTFHEKRDILKAVRKLNPE